MIRTKTRLFIGVSALACLFFLLHATLTIEYPFVHSDEPWLSGLTRFMMQERSIAVTEPFFDTYPRAPHAFKLLFHGIQALWFSLFGSSFVAARTLSLLFGSLSLILLASCVNTLYGQPFLAIASLLLASSSISFIYASHIARSEIMLIFFLLASFRFLLSERPYAGYLAALTAALSMALHPNGTLICLFILSMSVQDSTKRTKFLPMVLIMVGIGLLLAGISLLLNPSFLSDYLAYGATLGVDASPIVKLQRLPAFYQKLYLQISGTYYTPAIRLSMLISLSGILLLLIRSIMKRDYTSKPMRLLFSLGFMQLGFVAIGRYGQPSVILFYPVILMSLLGMGASLRSKWMVRSIVLILVLFGSLSSMVQITRSPYEHDSFQRYLTQVKSSIGPSGAILGNLNGQEAFELGRLYDWRNLEPAVRNGLSLEQYVQERQISWVIYPDEIDFIYANRPVYNGVYGNVALYYEQLQRLLESRAELVTEWTESTYAMRIVGQVSTQPWGFRVYRLSSEER